MDGRSRGATTAATPLSSWESRMSKQRSGTALEITYEPPAGSKVILPDGREAHVMFKHAELPRVVYVQVVEEFWMSLDELEAAR